MQQETTGRRGFIDAIVTIDDHTELLIDHKTTARAYERDSVQKSTQLALYAENLGKSKAGFITLVKKIRSNKVKVCVKCKHDSSASSHRTCPNTIEGVRCKGVLDVETRPEADVQVIVDDIDPYLSALVQKSFTETEDAIGKGVFPKNLTACDKMFGAKCPYFNYCRNGSMTNLTEVPEEK